MKEDEVGRLRGRARAEKERIDGQGGKCSEDHPEEDDDRQTA